MHTNFSTEHTQCLSVVEVNTIKTLVVFVVIFREDLPFGECDAIHFRLMSMSMPWDNGSALQTASRNLGYQYRSKYRDKINIIDACREL